MHNLLQTSPCILTTTSKDILAKYHRHLSFSSILSAQHEDDKLILIIQSLSHLDNTKLPGMQHYCLMKGVLFYRRHKTSDHWLVCVPEPPIDELIYSVHCHFGHVGPKKCILAIRDFCVFKGLQCRVRRVVKTCDLCQRTKPSTVRIQGERKSILATAPLERVLVDIYGSLPLGWNKVKYIFVVLDNFTRFVRLYPVKRATAIIVTNRMVNDYINVYGAPQCVVSDHGLQFSSKVWQSRLSVCGVPPTMTSVYHPQSNPAERVMRELGRLFRTYCHQQHTDWPQYIAYIEWVLNNTVHEATGCTPQELFLTAVRYNPFEAVVQFPFRDPLEHRTKLILAQEIQMTHSERRKQRHDKQGKPTIFEIGDQVLVRTHRLSSAIDQCIHKFFLLYEGPYIVIKKMAANAYTVADPVNQQTRGTFNVIHLRRYFVPESNLV